MFEPKDHLIQLKGKDYLQVAWRLCWLRDLHPDWILRTELIHLDREEGFAMFKAEIIEPHTEMPIATGHGSETKRDFGDYIEKAETKAVGRALAMAGLGTQFCFADFDEEDRIVDSPVEPGKKKAARKKPEVPAAQEPAPAGTENILKCEICGLPIKGVKAKDGSDLPPGQIAMIGQKRFGKCLCAGCQRQLAASGKQ